MCSNSNSSSFSARTEYAAMALTEAIIFSALIVSVAGAASTSLIRSCVLDLEMSGLDVETCYILEIGVVVTDYNLNII